MVVGDQLFDGIGAGSGYNAGFKIRSIHIDDAAVGISQAIHQGGVGLAGGNGQYLPLGLDIHDLGVAGGPVVVFQQMLQALLHSCPVHIPAGGEFHPIPEGNGPGAAAVVGPVGSQPGLQLHGVRIVNQSLTDTVTDAGPAVVGPVGVHGLFPVFGVEGGVTDDHGLLGRSGAGGLPFSAA